MSHDDPLSNNNEGRAPDPDAEPRASRPGGAEPLPGRRHFLRTGLAAGAASVIGMPAGLADGPGRLPPGVPSWTRRLGPGVASQPYGESSQCLRYTGCFGSALMHELAGTKRPMRTRVASHAVTLTFADRKAP